jgi:hypothetical protein
MVIAVLVMALLSPWLLVLVALLVAERIWGQEQTQKKQKPARRLECIVCGAHQFREVLPQTGDAGQREARRRPL